MEMTHTRTLWWAAVAMTAALMVACTARPSQEACEKAVLNIRKITGQTRSEPDAVERAAVRSCRAQSSRDTVDCYVHAQTVDALYACGGEMAEELRKARAKQSQESGQPPAPSPGQ